MQRNSYLPLRAGALLAGMLAFTSVSHAQVWGGIWGGLPGTEVYCSYFWDEDHGVVGGPNGVHFYNNGTWAMSSYPEQPDTVYSIRLLKPGVLYVAQGKTQIWSSTDSGRTWLGTGGSAGRSGIFHKQSQTVTAQSYQYDIYSSDMSIHYGIYPPKSQAGVTFTVFGSTIGASAVAEKTSGDRVLSIFPSIADKYTTIRMAVSDRPSHRHVSLSRSMRKFVLARSNWSMTSDGLLTRVRSYRANGISKLELTISRPVRTFAEFGLTVVSNRRNFLSSTKL